MIQVVAKHVVKQDKIESYIALAKELVAKTQKQDAGCIRYDLFQDLKDPRILTILEEWEDQASLDRHMAAAHFRELVPRLAEFCEEKTEMNLYRKVE